MSSLPSKCTSPAGRAGQLHDRRGRSCDLPQPDSPTRPSVSPGFTSRLTSETAWTFSPVRPTGNSTTRSSTRSSVSSAGRRWAVPLPAISRAARRVDAPSARRAGDARPCACVALLERGPVASGACPTGNQQRYSWPGVGRVDAAAAPRSRHLVLHVRAAGRELAARRRVDEVRRAAADGDRAGCGSASSSFGIERSSASVYGWRISANSVRVGAFSTTCPAYITAISSARPATTPRSWVTRIIAMNRSRCCSWSRSRIWACTVTSSAVVGSSAKSSFGPQASAMAIMTRWRMPPDSSCGYWLMRRSGSGMPDRLQQLERRSRWRTPS